MSMTDRQLALNTDIEILAEAFDDDPEDHPDKYPNYVSIRADDDYDPAAMHGWDDEPLSDEEQMHVARFGSGPNNFDRPLQLEQDLDYEDTIAQHRAEIASLRQQNAQLAHMADPGRQAREQAAREQGYYNIVSNPELAGQHMTQQAMRIQELEGSRVNASMGAAHRAHGHEFAAAYQNLTSMNPQHPAARALVQSIFNAEDPGQALMDWHRSTGGRPIPVAVGGGHSRGIIPSLNSGTPGARRSQGRPFEQRPQRLTERAGWPAGSDDEAPGFDARAEREVAAAMFEDA